MELKHTAGLVTKCVLVCTLLCLLSSCAAYRVPLNSFKQIFASNPVPRAAPCVPNTVTVKKGDTLYSIAKQYNVSVRSLITANRVKSPYDLKAGQEIIIPSSAFHIVAEGDTLYGISRRYNVDVRNLAKINRLSPPYSIYKGQRLILPSAIEEEKQTIKAVNRTQSKKVKTDKAKSSSASLKKTKTTKKKSATVQMKEPAARSSNRFAWPVTGKILLAFGDLGAGRHNDGINIKTTKGASVKAAENGIVVYAGDELKGFGNLILIKHSDGWVTAYAHNDKIVVKKGQEVKRGQEIAKAGNTGNVNTPQLHFEVRNKSKAKDPLLYLEKKS